MNTDEIVTIAKMPGDKTGEVIDIKCGEEFDFAKWGLASRLTSTTLQHLDNEELSNLESLKSLTRENILELKLSIGQRNALVSALKAFQQPAVQKPNVINWDGGSDARLTNKDLIKDRDLNELVKGLSDIHLKDYLTVNEEIMKGTPDNEKSKGEKLYVIPDFITKPRSSTQATETQIFGEGDTQVVMRSRARPPPEQVTLPQWIAAQARILKKLIDDGRAGMQEVQAYLDYTSQVGDLTQTYTVPSVMLMDDAHRRRQNSGGTPWDTVSFHDMFYHLEKRATHQPIRKQSNSANGGAGRSRQVDETGVPICINFQHPSGCKFPNCRFAHSCIVPGCKEKHPQYQHMEQPPRFRGK